MTILDRFDLTGRTVVITGASSGLGADTAVSLAQVGADLVLTARRVERLDETRRRVEAAGGECEVVPGDVADPETGTRVVEAAMARFGRVDVLVNNAGIGTAVPATRETPDQFRQVIEINLNGSYWMAQACGRVMQPGSSIINISSVLGLTTAGLPQSAYASSKAGVIGLTRDLAAQWTGRKGIRVNAIAPGFFVTEMTDEYPEGYLEKTVESRVPMARPGQPEEFVAAVLFLASDASSYVTGIVLPVDGGILTA
jgi:NAD(P)-dependent dehydrogenase (short-subunit alcohol dehydrogenase family)